jgi:hypothetical protein
MCGPGYAYRQHTSWCGMYVQYKRTVPYIQYVLYVRVSIKRHWEVPLGAPKQKFPYAFVDSYSCVYGVLYHPGKPFSEPSIKTDPFHVTIRNWAMFMNHHHD